MTTIHQSISQDDINELLKIFQQILEDKGGTDEQIFISRYQGILVQNDLDKRLLSRFLSRICEVFELQVQRRRVQFSGSKQFNERMQILQEQILYKPQNFSNLLTTIFQESRKAIGSTHLGVKQLALFACQNSRSADHNSSYSVINLDGQTGNNNDIYQIRDLAASQNDILGKSLSKIPPWYRNTLSNKSLNAFYDVKFWKLYEILQPDRNYYSTLFILHQTKQQNQERLLRQLIERNSNIFCTEWCSKIDENSFNAITAERKRFLEKDRSSILLSTNQNQIQPSKYPSIITMFGQDQPSSPTKKQNQNQNQNQNQTQRYRQSNINQIKVSPGRKYSYREDSVKVQTQLQKQQVPTQNIESPIKINLSQYATGPPPRIPGPLLKPVNQLKPLEEDNSILTTTSPLKSRKSSTINKTVVMNFPDLAPSRSQEPKERYTIIHRKDFSTRNTIKKIVNGQQENTQIMINSNLLFSNSHKNQGINTILFLERNMKNYLSKFE